MVAVCRPYDGITVNEEVEFVLDDNNEIMKFDNESTAKKFLRDNGVGEEYMDILHFVEIE